MSLVLVVQEFFGLLRERVKELTQRKIYEKISFLKPKKRLPQNTKQNQLSC